MALRLISRSPSGDEFLIDSVAPDRHLASQELDASNGRQDHASSPYASVALRLRNIGVHRNPSNVRDDGRRPSELGRDGQE